MRRYLIAAILCWLSAIILWWGVARAEIYHGFFVVDTAQWEAITEDLEIKPHLRDWKVIGSEAGKSVVYAIVDVPKSIAQKLAAKPGFLGQDYREIVQAAKAAPGLERTVVRKLWRTCWLGTGDPPPTICGSIDGWIAAGRPARTTDFAPPLCWLGHDCPTATQGEIE